MEIVGSGDNTIQKVGQTEPKEVRKEAITGNMSMGGKAENVLLKSFFQVNDETW